MQMYNADDVDAYIAASAPEAQPILNQLREIFRSVVPDVDEKISWGVPFYRHHGGVGGYATYKKHVSFGTGGDALPDDVRAELSDAGYKTGTRTIQIGFDQEVPSTIVRQLVDAQAKANEAKRAPL